jgi:hypothetical protein
MEHWYLLKNLFHRRFVYRKSHLALFVVFVVGGVARITKHGTSVIKLTFRSTPTLKCTQKQKVAANE